MSAKKINIEFQPIGKRIQAEAGENLLEILLRAGIDITSICSGKGTCGRCIVEQIKGSFNPSSATELEKLGKLGLTSPFRLACQAYPHSDVIVRIPTESLSAPQRVQVEGDESSVPPSRLWKILEHQFHPADQADLTSDLTRFRRELITEGFYKIEIPIQILNHLSDTIREQNWSARLAIRTDSGHHHLGTLHIEHHHPLGFAVDIGTTKIAGYLVDLEDGHTLCSEGLMNPLIPYGEDIISRIDYVNRHPGGKDLLHQKLLGAINDLITNLSQKAGVRAEDIVEASAVGNTVMHHLFCNLPISQLGYAPFIPSVSESLLIPSDSIGLNIAPGGMVYLPPNLAGYVGADHVAMLVASEIIDASGNVIALDIGTNTEISLLSQGQIFSCSCASGPAFEGAHISSGMRASDGAIEHVGFLDGEIKYQVIGNSQPIGICGSGILDAIAALRIQGILNEKGIFLKGEPGVVDDNGKLKYRLINPEKSASGKSIFITRSDVNQIQLAKAAIRAGIDSLLKVAKVDLNDLEGFIIAGAFGTYLDPESAIQIGMFPKLPISRIKQTGNAAGTGAKQLLLSKEKRMVAENISRNINYIELTTFPEFTEYFMRSMFL